ncbi:MAG: hypothetical protein ACI865_003073 [Flavobacteriaceae bacterium]|jgi:hypothetical protein
MEKLVKCVLPKKMSCRFIIAVLIIFASAATTQAQSIQHTFEKPASDLSKEKLTKTDLVAFQNRAVEKVDELFQYLKVMADHKTNAAVRDRALTIAEKQFSESAQIRSDSFGQPIEAYLKLCRNSTDYKAVESLSVSKPFTYKFDGHFEGEIHVNYKRQDSKKEIKSPKLREEEITIFLIRKEKSFGTTKQFVWELSLGNIEM